MDKCLPCTKSEFLLLLNLINFQKVFLKIRYNITIDLFGSRRDCQYKTYQNMFICKGSLNIKIHETIQNCQFFQHITKSG